MYTSGGQAQPGGGSTSSKISFATRATSCRSSVLGVWAAARDAIAKNAAPQSITDIATRTMWELLRKTVPILGVPCPRPGVGMLARAPGHGHSEQWPWHTEAHGRRNHHYDDPPPRKVSAAREKV